jgi:hypothetical protein
VQGQRQMLRVSKRTLKCAQRQMQHARRPTQMRVPKQMPTRAQRRMQRVLRQTLMRAQRPTRHG